jgi:hypothetical protein
LEDLGQGHRGQIPLDRHDLALVVKARLCGGFGKLPPRYCREHRRLLDSPIVEIYKVPRRELDVRILLDDGRTLDGSLFASITDSMGGPEDALHFLNSNSEDFIPLMCGKDSFLLNKAGIIWVQLSGESAREVAESHNTGRSVPVRLSLAGGLSVVGTLSIVMPPERNRVLDYMNAMGRFVPLFGDGVATLVQRGFVVSVRSADGNGASSS